MAEVNFCLNEDLVNALKDISQSEGISVSDLVSSVLETFVDERSGVLDEETLQGIKNVDKLDDYETFNSTDELF